MGELKKHQPPMTIDEQVENLKNIGLIVDDEEYAKKILNDISYFRLIKAYSLNLKSKNGCYNKQTAFKEIVDLYLFNSNFRQLIFPEIEKVEINVRCRLANFFAEQYGVLGYLQAENFSNENYHAQFLEDIKEEVRRNSKAPFVRNFKENYEGGNLPIYALVEVFSFGTLSKFYKNMLNKDKKVCICILFFMDHNDLSDLGNLLRINSYAVKIFYCNLCSNLSVRSVLIPSNIMQKCRKYNNIQITA